MSTSSTPAIGKGGGQEGEGGVEGGTVKGGVQEDGVAAAAAGTTADGGGAGDGGGGGRPVREVVTVEDYTDFKRSMPLFALRKPTPVEPIEVDLDQSKLWKTAWDDTMPAFDQQFYVLWSPGHLAGRAGRVFWASLSPGRRVFLCAAAVGDVPGRQAGRHAGRHARKCPPLSEDCVILLGEERVQAVSKQHVASTQTGRVRSARAVHDFVT